MRTFRPIAMRCTQSQFEEIKPKLKGVHTYDVDFYLYSRSPYLINNLSGKKGAISNIPEHYKSDYSREVHEEWNERIFLEACGIEIETLQDRLANLEKEIKEVKALIEEENKPKIGDICKFWDDDKSIFIVGKLEDVTDIEIFTYCAHDGIGFKNCIKITDPTLLESLNRLFK